ncbi:MAG: hypothetical protein LBP35_01220 [Candidatus Ancillula trichonymphae]|jgi:cytoskeletal protein RodZ|nr:hypothetical protein [Candidatus Ancillula trichonymphae]
MKDEELDKTIEEQDIPDAHPAVRDMLREVVLGAQGHAGASQNFEAFSDIDEELNADKKMRFEIDRRSLIAGIVAFVLIAALGVYFAYNAGVSARTSSEQVVKKSAESKTTESASPENVSTTTAGTSANPATTCPESAVQGCAIDANHVVNINIATESDLTTLFRSWTSNCQAHH